MSKHTNYNKPETINTEVTTETTEEKIVEIFGKVSNCKKLNVRVKPNTKCDVVCVIDKGAAVKIDKSKSTRAFYKVLGNDFEGFCMKEYITVEQ